MEDMKRKTIETRMLKEYLNTPSVKLYCICIDGASCFRWRMYALQNAVRLVDADET